MNAPLQLNSLARCSIHTISTKPWSLRQCLEGYRAAGVNALTVWRHALQPQGLAESAKMLKDSGMTVTALCRGGFFPSETAEGRAKAIDDNLLAIDEAAAIGAPMVVLVCGAVPGMPLVEARKQISDGIAACLPHARAHNVTLAIEPLHPMYAADRSAVNTMRQAREICDWLHDPLVKIAVDVYHVWWDPFLDSEIKTSGNAGYLGAFHVCDWKPAMTDPLNDRGLPGEGCIDIKKIRGWMHEAGFNGWNEIEIFSNARWAGDQAAFVADMTRAYLQHV